MVSIAFGERNQVGAVEIDPIVVDEVRILARVSSAGAEPDLPLLFIDAIDAADDELALG